MKVFMVMLKKKIAPFKDIMNYILCYNLNKINLDYNYESYKREYTLFFTRDQR